MSVAIVADAACDLPKEFIATRNIHILPIHLRFGDQSATDTRDPSLALRFYRTYIEHKDINTETTPYTAQETASFLKRLLAHHEQILCVTITSARSKIHENVSQAAHHLRAATATSRIRVIDSNSLFAGQAIIVAAAAELAAEGASLQDLLRAIEPLPSIVQGYAVPHDLYYIRARARKRGDKSVGLLQYLAGQALDIKPVIHARGPNTDVVEKLRGFDQAVTSVFDKAIAVIKQGLRFPVLALSYAGNPKEVTAFPRYRELEATAKAHAVQLLISVMSPTGGVYLGPGALTVGFLPKG